MRKALIRKSRENRDRDGFRQAGLGRRRPSLAEKLGAPAARLALAAALLALALTAATGCDWLAGGPAAMERLVTRDMTPQGINGSRSGKGGGPDAALGGQARSSGALVPSPGAIAGPGERPGSPESWGESSRWGAARQFDPIRFSEGDAELDLAARRQLQDAVDWLKANPRVWALLAGHCGRSATARYAYGIGMERALATREFLVMQGVEAWRVYCISYGTDRPVASGASPDANALNDRVEIFGFMQPDGVAAPKPVAETGKNAPPPRAPASGHVFKDLPK